MNGTGSPAKGFAPLLAGACVLLLGNGIVVPAIAAPLSIESSMTPLTSEATDTVPNGSAQLARPFRKPR